MEWDSIKQLLDYGGLGLLCLLEAAAIRFLWARLERANEALMSLEQKRADENKARLDQVLQAMGERQQRSQTGYSMQTSTSRIRE